MHFARMEITSLLFFLYMERRHSHPSTKSMPLLWIACYGYSTLFTKMLAYYSWHSSGRQCVAYPKNVSPCLWQGPTWLCL